jgi:Ca2+-binding EF-hand superfamily protein
MGALAAISGCATVKDTFESTHLASAFNEFDKDDDGVISRQEAEAYGPLADNFDGIDTNRSGGIDTNEYGAATRQVANISFERTDINGDGVISEREADAMPFSLREIFGDVDADGDANVSSVEYQAASVNLLQGMNFDDVDRDGDGVISSREANKVSVLSEMYKRVDTDADGLISRQEYGAAQRCC